MQPSALSPEQKRQAAAQLRAELEAEGVDVDAELAKRLTSDLIDIETPPAWMLRHAGQMAAWEARARFLLIMAGWQSGKTDFLVWWTLRQMGRKGPGEALVCAPTHPLLSVALEPRLVKAVESRGLGVHKASDNYIVVPAKSLRRLGWKGENGELVVFIRHTMEAKYVESVTALWVAGDECGQMSDEVGEAIDGRLSATGGEACLISRHYNDNWFSRQCVEGDTPLRKVIGFASWDNPGWRPDLSGDARLAEIERIRASMPSHRFDGKYAGKVTRPAGAIIDNWKDEYEYAHFLIPGDWKRYTFHDFGPVHAFIISVAEHPTEKDSEGYPVLYCYREHFPNTGTATKDLVKSVRDADLVDFAYWSASTGEEEPEWRPRGIGGITSEEGWRESYTAAGLPVEQPRVGDVGSQIDALYGCVGRGGLRVSKDCAFLLAMLKAWSWELDAAGDPIPGKILNDAAFHGPAALRYGASQLRPTVRDKKPEPPEPPYGSVGHLRQVLYGDQEN